MKKIIFFYGQPEMSDLLSPFLKLLAETFNISEYKTGEAFSPGEKIIPLAYSAGAINAINYELRNKGVSEKIILISPAGKINRSFLGHIMAFRESLKQFSVIDEKEAQKIWNEIQSIILKNPLDLLRAIYEIKNFPLDSKIKILEKRGVTVIQIHADKDYFMFDGKKNKGDIIVPNSLAGHFEIIHSPQNFTTAVKKAIES